MADLLMKMPLPYEPKRQNRFILRFPSSMGINEWFVESTSRPSIKMDPVEIQFLNTSTFVSGRFTWNTINVKFILLSGASDYTTPIDLFHSEEDFFKFINNDKIIIWHCQNCISPHPKIKLLPIGLDYHTLSYRNYDKWGNKAEPMTQENELIAVKNTALPFWDRKIKAYSNFHFQMNTKFSHDRRDAINMINKEIVYYEPTEIKRIETWKNQLTYAFVISPHGNGLDCHRLWEALVLGCIPIVRTSPLDKMYIDLPVLILNKWGDLTQELLEKTVNSEQSQTELNDLTRQIADLEKKQTEYKQGTPEKENGSNAKETSKSRWSAAISIRFYKRKRRAKDDGNQQRINNILQKSKESANPGERNEIQENPRTQDSKPSQ
jgi:hypothetical protein